MKKREDVIVIRYEKSLLPQWHIHRAANFWDKPISSFVAALHSEKRARDFCDTNGYRCVAVFPNIDAVDKTRFREDRSSLDGRKKQGCGGRRDVGHHGAPDNQEHDNQRRREASGARGGNTVGQGREAALGREWLGF